MKLLSEDISEAIKKWKSRHPEHAAVNLKVSVSFEQCNSCSLWNPLAPCPMVNHYTGPNEWCDEYCNK